MSPQNYRFNPVHEQVYKQLASGTIGKVISVHFEWMLDTVHGADYFRRWHRLKEKSGGLMVHKSGHHFDLVSRPLCYAGRLHQGICLLIEDVPLFLLARSIGGFNPRPNGFSGWVNLDSTETRMENPQVGLEITSELSDRNKPRGIRLLCISMRIRS